MQSHSVAILFGMFWCATLTEWDHLFELFKIGRVFYVHFFFFIIFHFTKFLAVVGCDSVRICTRVFFIYFKGVGFFYMFFFYYKRLFFFVFFEGFKYFVYTVRWWNNFLWYFWILNVLFVNENKWMSLKHDLNF